MSHGDDQSNATWCVETLSLRTLQERAGTSHIDLLKLDIEGAEFGLLAETGDETLSGIGQITVEFHDFLFEFKGQRLYEAAQKRLKSLGFLSCPMAFRTHGDVLFLNSRIIPLPFLQRAGVSWMGRWLLKCREGILSY